MTTFRCDRDGRELALTLGEPAERLGADALLVGRHDDECIALTRDQLHWLVVTAGPAALDRLYGPESS